MYWGPRGLPPAGPPPVAFQPPAPSCLSPGPGPTKPGSPLQPGAGPTALLRGGSPWLGGRRQRLAGIFVVISLATALCRERPRLPSSRTASGPSARGLRPHPAGTAPR